MYACIHKDIHAYMYAYIHRSVPTTQLGWLHTRLRHVRFTEFTDAHRWLIELTSNIVRNTYMEDKFGFRRKALKGRDGVLHYAACASHLQDHANTTHAQVCFICAHHDYVNGWFQP